MTDSQETQTQHGKNIKNGRPGKELIIDSEPKVLKRKGVKRPVIVKTQCKNPVLEAGLGEALIIDNLRLQHTLLEMGGHIGCRPATDTLFLIISQAAKERGEVDLDEESQT